MNHSISGHLYANIHITKCLIHSVSVSVCFHLTWSKYGECHGIFKIPYFKVQPMIIFDTDNNQTSNFQLSMCGQVVKKNQKSSTFAKFIWYLKHSSFYFFSNCSKNLNSHFFATTQEKKYVIKRIVFVGTSGIIIFSLEIFCEILWWLLFSFHRHHHYLCKHYIVCCCCFSFDALKFRFGQVVWIRIYCLNFCFNFDCFCYR